MMNSEDYLETKDNNKEASRTSCKMKPTNIDKFWPKYFNREFDPNSMTTSNNSNAQNTNILKGKTGNLIIYI